MVVDLGIQSFVKDVVSIAIAGAVVVGVGVYGLIWADQRLKSKRRVVGPPQLSVPAESEEEDEAGSVADSVGS